MKFPPEHKFTKLSLLRRGPSSVLQMINKAKNIDELKKFFKEFSDRDRRRIEQKTKNQSENENWFLYRQATISGTIAKRVVTQIKREKTSIPLNRSISKFRSRGFTCPAIEYGTSNKKKGIDVLWTQFKKDHHMAKMYKMGLVVDTELPFLCGTPDIVFSCENCCIPQKIRYFVGGIKCPYRLKDVGLQDWKSLEYINENSELKPTHPYYYQITLYCGLMNASLGYFVIWTPAGHLFLEVPFNVELFNLIRNSAKKYFYEHYVKNFFD